VGGSWERAASGGPTDGVLELEEHHVVDARSSKGPRCGQSRHTGAHDDDGGSRFARSRRRRGRAVANGVPARGILSSHAELDRASATTRSITATPCDATERRSSRE
jgi:hypothetical protein